MRGGRYRLCCQSIPFGGNVAVRPVAHERCGWPQVCRWLWHRYHF